MNTEISRKVNYCTICQRTGQQAALNLKMLLPLIEDNADKQISKFDKQMMLIPKALFVASFPKNI